MAFGAADTTEPDAAGAAGFHSLMKAAVYTRYGPPDVLEIKDVEKPVPKDNEVLVRIHATTVCAADWRIRKADPFIVRFMNGLWGPKKIHILGAEFAGTVESVGNAVTRFGKGDQVFGSTGLKFGAHAEYACLPEDALLAIKPVNMTFEEAAAVLFGGVSALHFLRKAKIQAGQKVLIYGASGSVGVFAVQLAKHFGAHVTGVCSTANLDLVKSLGADDVVDYTREDFSRAGRVYDIVFDTVGKSGFSRSLKSLKRGGSYVLVGGSGRLLSILGVILRGMWVSLTGAAKVISGIARPAPGDQSFLKELIEAGKLRTVIDRRYSLDEIAEAHRHAEAGHKKGHVVILLEQIVTSDAFSREKRDHMRALGARITLVASLAGGMTKALTLEMIETARRLAAAPGSYWTDQLNNTDQLSSYERMGEEIWQQTNGRVSAFVQSVGTAGSLRGISTRLRAHREAVQIVAVEPAESAVLSGRPSGSHKIEGIGAGFVVPLWTETLADEIQTISTEEAMATARRLACEEGVFAGTSTGGNVAVALRVAARLGPDRTVVTVAVDSGMKYLSTALYAQT